MNFFKGVGAYLVFALVLILFYGFVDGLGSSPLIVQVVGFGGIGYFMWRWFKSSGY